MLLSIKLYIIYYNLVIICSGMYGEYLRSCITSILDFCSFLYLRQGIALHSQEWNTNLQEYIHKGHLPDEIKYMIPHVEYNKIRNIEDQLLYLSCISNYHWWQYIRCDGTKSRSGIHVRLTDHLLYHPSCEEGEEGLKLKYIPESPRNRIMYFYVQMK